MSIRQKSPQIPCKARAKTGKLCKKMTMPGYDFCRVDGFGRLKGTLWYENGIFLAVVTSVALKSYVE